MSKPTTETAEQPSGNAKISISSSTEEASLEDSSRPAESPKPETSTGGANPPETPETGREQPVEAPETPVEPDSTQPDLDALQAENDALKAEVQRLRVAAESGVPPELLTGTTDEELQASAAALVAFAARRSGVPDFGAGNRGNNDVVVVDPIRQELGR